MLSKIKDFLFGSKPEKIEASSTENTNQRHYTVRDGELTPTDEVFYAWTTRDLEKMRVALKIKTSLVDRHFLLMTFVNETYKLRKNNPEARDLCVEISEKHIEEFPAIKPALVKSLDGMLPRVTTFQKYATLFTEQGQYRRVNFISNAHPSEQLQEYMSLFYSQPLSLLGAWEDMVDCRIPAISYLSPEERERASPQAGHK